MHIFLGFVDFLSYEKVGYISAKLFYSSLKKNIKYIVKLLTIIFYNN